MRFHVGDRVRITSDHPYRGAFGRVKYIGEVCGFYVQLETPQPSFRIPKFDDDESLVTWAQHVEHAPGGKQPGLPIGYPLGPASTPQKDRDGGSS